MKRRRRKRKLTQTVTTLMKMSLLKSLATSLAQVLRTIPLTCLQVSPYPCCLWPININHSTGLLQRLHLKCLSLPMTLATSWSHRCGHLSNALCAPSACIRLPTKPTSSVISYCIGRCDESFPAFSAPNSSTGLTTWSGTFEACTSSTWTQRGDASRFHLAQYCDASFVAMAEGHICHPCC